MNIQEASAISGIACVDDAHTESTGLAGELVDRVKSHGTSTVSQANVLGAGNWLEVRINLSNGYGVDALRAVGAEHCVS